MNQQLVLDGRVINRELVYRDIGFYETVNMVLACTYRQIEQHYKRVQSSSWDTKETRHYEDLSNMIQTISHVDDPDRPEKCYTNYSMDLIRELHGKERLIERLTEFVNDTGRLFDRNGILIKIDKSEDTVKQNHKRFYSAVEEMAQCGIEFKFGD